MLAVPAAVVDSAALVAAVPREPAVPVQARLVLVRLPVLADLLLGPAVLVRAHLAFLVQRPVPAVPHPRREPAAPPLAQLLVLVHRVLEPAAQLQLLLSRQSFSAAMA